MILDIIEYGIKIYMVDYRGSRQGGRYLNNMKKPELAHNPPRKMWIHEARPTSQLFKVEGYVVQGTCLEVTLVHEKAYAISYNADTKHPKRLYGLIPLHGEKGQVSRKSVSMKLM